VNDRPAKRRPPQFPEKPSAWRRQERQEGRVSRLTSEDGSMEFGRYVFGSIEIDGVTYEHDVVIEGERTRKRKKGPSKALRGG
jgi:hypothetical protein